MKDKDKAYEFRLKDIADSTTLRVKTVERAVRRGHLYPNNIADVARYIMMWRMKFRMDAA